MRRRLIAVLSALTLVAGLAIPAGASSPRTATYEVTFENLPDAVPAPCCGLANPKSSNLTAPSGVT